MPTAASSQLRRLALAAGVQTAYYDVVGKRQTADADALKAALAALRIDLAEGVDHAFHEWRLERAARGLEPVAVAWDGRLGDLVLNLREAGASGTARLRIELEDGELRDRSLDLSACPPLEPNELEDLHYVALRLPVSEKLPIGYHRLTVETANERFESLVISAPRRAWSPPEGALQTWGVFLPLYALDTNRCWGAGDFAGLEELARWIGERGGGCLATLPLLAGALDQPYDPSPYAPVSRRFWNEFYIAIENVPELARCEAARRLVESDAVRGQIESLRKTDQVEYRAVMALKRRVLEELARTFFDEPDRRFADFERLLAERPQLGDYASFRAAWEKQGRWWKEWPDPMRTGELAPGDYDESVRRFWLYAQFVATEQLVGAAKSAAQRGVHLYLDLPLGARTDGYDVWRYQPAYADGASAGAPPDVIFTGGQNWGFSPLHPEVVREQGYRPLRDVLRHHMRDARWLRIDHVMGLHRLYWIPQGVPNNRGVYVRYRDDETYAILNLESHRYQTLVIGENLGTVPAEVNRALDKSAVRRMHVVEYEIEAVPKRPMAEPPKGGAASVNTHDMPMFAAWWTGRDLELRRDLGLIDDAGVESERQRRAAQKTLLVQRAQAQGFVAPGLTPDAADPAAVLKAALVELSRGPSELVVVNLEDLWGELEPQNVPGTSFERPNWRRKADHSLERLRELPEVNEPLAAVARARPAAREETSRG
ncbi:MAG: 4-alpha-glucanotransferase [Planctomycetes bacterium]|nr:4-alpha-glucanotransferase [Planctomycetota bacterium]